MGHCKVLNLLKHRSRLKILAKDKHTSLLSRKGKGTEIVIYTQREPGQDKLPASLFCIMGY